MDNQITCTRKWKVHDYHKWTEDENQTIRLAIAKVGFVPTKIARDYFPDKEPNKVHAHINQLKQGT